MNTTTSVHVMLDHADDVTPRAWQHPELLGSFTVMLDSNDASTHIALSGPPDQLATVLQRAQDALAGTVDAAASPHRPRSRPPSVQAPGISTTPGPAS